MWNGKIEYPAVSSITRLQPFLGEDSSVQLDLEAGQPLQTVLNPPGLYIGKHAPPPEKNRRHVKVKIRKGEKLR
jgi:hypothetical protein